MSEETWSADELAQQILATMDSVAIVERVRAVAESDKAIATVKEIKKRYKLTADELADVAKAIKEVGNQIDDIDNALKGEARKGRKNGK
jgi:signal recognition particle GTPase